MSPGGKDFFDYFTYTINNVPPVRRVQCMKDLGVSVTSELSWNSHIEQISIQM